MLERAFRGQVAFGATGHYAAFAVVVRRQFPAFIRLRVHMARLARLVRRTLHVNSVQSDRDARSDGNRRYDS